MIMIDAKKPFIDILNHLNNKYEWFSKRTPKGSITNTELFYIYRYLLTINNPVIFESGVDKGRSTLILSEIVNRLGGTLHAAVYNWQYASIDLSFLNEYKNTNLIHGRSEDLINNFTEIDVSVIDGPKPAGYKWGNPGWSELVDKSCDIVDVMFQHDIGDHDSLSIFNDVGYDKYIISQEFLLANDIFGCEESWKETKPNLGVIIFNKNVNHTYFASRS